MSSIRIGPFQTVRRIGRGTCGTVFLADVLEDTQSLRKGAQIALKLLKAEFAPSDKVALRFRREARAGAALDSVNVVRVYDIDTTYLDGEPRLYLAMEYCDGGDLRQRLDSTGGLLERQVIQISLAIAQGLVTCHAAGIVHRDLKPENILFRGDGSVAIGDLGLAKVIDASVDLSSTGGLVGTPKYTAPEGARGGPLSCDERSDLFALGVILYEMLAGVYPFNQRDGLIPLLQSIYTDNPNPLEEACPAISPSLARIVKRLLEKSPEDRPGSAAVVVDLLLNTLAHYADTVATGGSAMPRAASRIEAASRSPSGSLASASSKSEAPVGGGGKRPGMSNEAEVERVAVLAVERQFLDAGGHEFENPRRDYGRDDRVIIKVDGGAAGFSVGVQIKGTRSIDTETRRGFRFRIKVSNLTYLDNTLEPHYYMIHNCDAGTTYFREAHGIAAYLDACKPGWREQETVTVTFQTESLLTDAEVQRICVEAEAWTVERRTTMELVKFIEGEIARFAMSQDSTVESVEGKFQWTKLSGGFLAKSPRDCMDLLLLVSNLSQGLALCHYYHQRQSRVMLPHEITATGHGPLDMTELTRRLREVKESHVSLLERHETQVKGAEPREDPDWKAPAEAGLLAPRIEDLPASEAAGAVRAHLERLGLVVEEHEDEPLDMVVSCGNARGFLSLAVFGSSVKRERITQVRHDMNALGGCAGTILIKWCQFESLGLHTWEKPKTEPEPRVPIGTPVPMVEDFVAALLDGAIASNSWPERSVYAATIPMGYSMQMPDFAAPKTEEANTVQCAAVRRHVGSALDRVREHKPIWFVFLWGMDRVEVYTITCASELAAFVLRGPSAFRELGGSYMRSRR